METNPLDVTAIFSLFKKIAEEYTPNNKEYALSEEEMKTFYILEAFKSFSGINNCLTDDTTEGTTEEKAECTTEEQSANIHEFYCIIVKQIELISNLAVHSPEFEQTFFKGNHKILKPIDFYNLSYFLMQICVALDNRYKDFILATYIAIMGISLEKLILDYENENDNPDTLNISVWSFSERLKELSPKEVSLILEMLETDRNTKSLLLRYVSESQPENFINTILTLSINYDKAAYIAQFWSALINHRNLYHDYLNQNLRSEDFKEIIKKYCLKANHSVIDTEVSKSCYDLISPNYHPFETLQVVNIDYHYTFLHTIESIYSDIEFHNTWFKYSTNFEAVQQVNEIISKWEFIQGLKKHLFYEDIALSDIYDCKALEKFKNKFIRELNIPESVGQKKESNDYFCYTDQEKTLSEEKCFNIYKALTNEGLLKWDEEVFFSFQYRMCNNYKPQRNDPSQIIWQGETRELFSLIWEYHEGTTKIWAKTKKFFLDSQGKELKTNGAKHQTEPTERMKKIFDSIK